MAKLTVNTTADTVDGGDGVLSLREAITQANATAAADSIVFAASIAGETIKLTQGQLGVTKDLTIDGNANGGSGITIDAQGDSRVMQITGSSTDVAFDHLTLTNGNSNGADGGNIALGAAADLTLVDSSVTRGY